MVVLQAYQADLLKEFDYKGLAPEIVKELCRATDLALRANKQNARAIGRSMTAVVLMEQHLWLNLTGIKERDKASLLAIHPIFTKEQLKHLASSVGP